MDQKLIQAVKSMAAHPQYMFDVIKSGDSIYFKYKSYIWSMYYDKSSEHYYLTFFPKETDVHKAELDRGHPESPTLTYSTEDYYVDSGSFSDLYQTLTSKLYGLDSVLDDIITDSDF